jgi:glutathione synthase/RimK-type ligase-like ATP-grasp enzyme
MGSFNPKRGRFFYNRTISKERQAELFANAGIRTPKTITFSAGMILDRDAWGPHVVVKPNDISQTSKGESAYLVQLEKLNDPLSLPGGLREIICTTPVLVQEFIPTGPHATSYRVGTFLGRIIHMMKKSTAARMPDLGTMIGEGTSIDSNYDSASAARELMTDDQIMALAIKIADIFPGLPLLGIDIIKHVETGELFALEVNGGGNTWQFSSRQAAHGRLIIGKEERVRQFDAWNTCARALVETTRSHAS